LYEETGLIAKELTLLGVFSGKEMHNIYPNGDEVSNVDIVYICKSYEGELKCQAGEVENLKFFDISALPDNIFKPNLPAIEEYISKQKRERINKMDFVWRDYNPETMGYVENWLDEHAVKMTGMDDGFRQEYEYWANEDYNTVGENFWCKVVFENEIPFAVIEFGLYEGVVTIMETFVAPEQRGQGMGSKAIKELIKNSKTIIGIDIEKAEAIIFPSNIASQKAFEKAGFKYHHTNEDGDAMTYIYEKKED